MKIEEHTHGQMVKIPEVPIGMVFRARSGEIYMMTHISYSRTNKYYCVHLKTGVTDSISPLASVEPLPNAKVVIEY